MAGSLDDSEDSNRPAQFHGHFPKYTMSLAGSSYIAKIGSKSGGYEGIALTEKVCNDIGKILDIPIAPNFHLIWFKDRPCFLVKNFIEGNHNDLVHLASLWPRLKNGNLEPYYLETLIPLIKSTAGYSASKTVIFTIIFDYLIGNGDRHRQNIGFIRSAKGMVLAPIYDSVSDLGLEQEEFLDPADKMHPTMRVTYKKQTNADIDGYFEVMSQLGFKKEVGIFASRIKSKQRQIQELIGVSFVTKNLKSCLYELVERRSSEIDVAWSQIQ